MGAQSEVVGGEPFPQGEESLVFDHLRIRIQFSSVTWSLTIPWQGRLQLPYIQGHRPHISSTAV